MTISSLTWELQLEILARSMPHHIIIIVKVPSNQWNWSRYFVCWTTFTGAPFFSHRSLLLALAVVVAFIFDALLFFLLVRRLLFSIKIYLMCRVDVLQILASSLSLSSAANVSYRLHLWHCVHLKLNDTTAAKKNLWPSGMAVEVKSRLETEWNAKFSWRWKKKHRSTTPQSLGRAFHSRSHQQQNITENINRSTMTNIDRAEVSLWEKRIIVDVQWNQFFDVVRFWTMHLAPLRESSV